MKFYIKDHLTLDEQIWEWYSSSEVEVNRLAKYLEERIEEKECEAYSEGYDAGVERYYME